MEAHPGDEGGGGPYACQCTMRWLFPARYLPRPTHVVLPGMSTWSLDSFDSAQTSNIAGAYNSRCGRSQGTRSRDDGLTICARSEIFASSGRNCSAYTAQTLVSLPLLTLHESFRVAVQLSIGDLVSPCKAYDRNSMINVTGHASAESMPWNSVECCDISGLWV